MCRLRNIAMRNYHEKSGYQEKCDYWTDRQTHGQTDGQTDTGQSDPYALLCFACDTTMTKIPLCVTSGDVKWFINKDPQSGICYKVRLTEFLQYVIL